MKLGERLEADLKTAMKAREPVRVVTIRAIRGAVRNKEIEVRGELDDDAMLRVIRGLVKQRDEAIEQYRAADRDELADREIEEKAILEEYLPAAPDAAAIERVVREVIEELGASSPKDMGRVMKPALERLGPVADGKQVSVVVRHLLTADPEETK